jgi:hypothetical protein
MVRSARTTRRTTASNLIRITLLLLVLGATGAAQETANISRLRRQCVVSPRLRADVVAYRITWGTVRLERFTRLGKDEYYAQLCYPKLWMGQTADASRRSAALYASVWRLPKGKKIATLEHFIFQDQGKVEAPRQIETPIGKVWHLRAPCICASKINLDAYFLIRDQHLRRLDTDSWERELSLPSGTVKAEGLHLNLAAMEGRAKLSKDGQPAGSLRASLRLEGLKLAVDRTQLEP